MVRTNPSRARRARVRAALLVLVPLWAALLGSGDASAQPVMTAVQATAVRTLQVTFNQDVDPTTGGTATNYLVFETASATNRITVSTATVSGSTVTLGLAADLVSGRGYTLRSQNIRAVGGTVGSGVQSLTFTWSDGNTRTIASVQQNATSLEGQPVTVEGVVYIPSTHLQPNSGNWSAYIQDSSGRGINVFGFSSDALAASTALQTVGNRVRVTGTVTFFFTTVEIASLTEVTLLGTNQTVPGPQVLTTAAANDAQWEGTHVQVTGTVTGTSTSGPGRNVVVNDGSGAITIRVLNSLNAAAANVGDTVTARGAGSQFQTTFQITVGRAADFQVTPGGGGGGGDVTPIAQVHRDLEGLEGQAVTVEGVVYIPSTHLQPNSGNWSAYIQDESGRGVNVFGFSDNTAAANPALQQVGNRVRVSGVVTLFFTTVEIADLTSVTLVSAGTTPPPAQPLSTAAANDSRWEGTYIQVTGTLLSSSRGGPGTNYVVDDGSGQIVVRALDSVGVVAPSFGTVITARGAGSQFQTTYQINVGLASDFFEGTDTEDRVPPRVVEAYRSDDARVTVVFDEALEDSSAEDAENYTIGGGGGNARSVTAAAQIEPGKVVLSLDLDLDVDDGYTLTVSGVGDLAGNVMANPVTVPIEAPPSTLVGLDAPARTFVPRLGEQYPFTITVPRSLFEGQRFAGEVQLRIFDLRGRVLVTLFDSRFDGANDFADDSQAVVVWDGRNDYSELVPAGAYVAHLLVVDERSGKRNEQQLPVVVAARLD